MTEKGRSALAWVDLGGEWRDLQGADRMRALMAGKFESSRG